MTTRDEYLQQPIEARLARLARTADDLAAAIRGHDDTTLSRRPEPKAWSAKEVICHLRDIEELCILRYHAMLSMDEPKMFLVGLAAKDPAVRSTPSAGRRSVNTSATTRPRRSALFAAGAGRCWASCAR
jgi:hypothetical protein